MSLILVRMKKPKKQKKPLTTQLRPSTRGRWEWEWKWSWGWCEGFILTTGTWPIISVCLTSFAVYSMMMIITMTHSAVGQPWGSGRHSRSFLQVGCPLTPGTYENEGSSKSVFNLIISITDSSLGFWSRGGGGGSFVCLTNLLSSVKSKGVDYRR